MKQIFKGIYHTLFLFLFLSLLLPSALSGQTSFIDNEVPEARGAFSHAAGYEACARTEMIGSADLREEVMEQVGQRYGSPRQRQYTDYQ